MKVQMKADFTSNVSFDKGGDRLRPLLHFLSPFQVLLVNSILKT